MSFTNFRNSFDVQLLFQFFFSFLLRTIFLVLCMHNSNREKQGKVLIERLECFRFHSSVIPYAGDLRLDVVYLTKHTATNFLG